MKAFYLTFLILLVSCFSYAQRNTTTNTNPPTAPNIRTMAEWEEIEAIVVSWKNFKNTLAEIVRHAKKEVKVYIITDNVVNTKLELAFKQIDTINIEFIEQDINTVWVRDYGATTIYGNHVDSVYLIDWIYNRPRPLDDSIPRVISAYTNIPLFATTSNPYDLVHTGGNFMSDGRGTAFSSNLVLLENGPDGLYNPTVKSEAQIDSIMKEFMGIRRYIKMDTLPYDGIHHIDMHMKLLNEETLLVGEYPQGVADGPIIEANLKYITDNFKSVFGTPFRVIRVPMPPDECGLYPDQWGKCPWELNNHLGYYRTYTNFLFVNKTVLVPIYDPQYDSTALNIIQAELPGYKVVGIDCNAPIRALGAVHCITKAIGTKAPLLISHQPLRNTTDTLQSYMVEALIQHQSGIQDATVYFTTDTAAGFFSVPMVGLPNDKWQGFIPPKSKGETIYYYIKANAFSGKEQIRPITAPMGFWQFKVGSTTNTKQVVPLSFQLLDIYPNPAQHKAIIPIEITESSMVSLKIYDVLGRNLKTIFEGNLLQGRTFFELNTRELAKGMYAIVLESEDGRVSQRLIVE